MADAPRMRASDQDRDEAVLALRDHHADGRIDINEFTTRMEQAHSAVYLDDLDPLFVDLPPRRSTLAVRTPATPARRRGPSHRLFYLLIPLGLAALAFGPNFAFGGMAGSPFVGGYNPGMGMEPHHGGSSILPFLLPLLLILFVVTRRRRHHGRPNHHHGWDRSVRGPHQ